MEISFPDYEQAPSSHSKKTVVIKTVELKDGEVKMILLKDTSWAIRNATILLSFNM